MSKASAPVAPSNENETVRIKKIENGYIISKESYSKKGGYECKEHFSPTKPSLLPAEPRPTARTPKSSGNALMRAATKGLKK